jgi:hypothetical protein
MPAEVCDQIQSVDMVSEIRSLSLAAKQSASFESFELVHCLEELSI